MPLIGDGPLAKAVLEDFQSRDPDLVTAKVRNIFVRELREARAMDAVPTLVQVFPPDGPREQHTQIPLPLAGGHDGR